MQPTSKAEVEKFCEIIQSYVVAFARMAVLAAEADDLPMTEAMLDCVDSLVKIQEVARQGISQLDAN